MKKERWKSIPEHDGYEVSDRGRVRSVDRIIHRQRQGGVVEYLMRGRLLKQGLSGSGYLQVALGRGKSFLVHRLVAIAFVAGDTALTVNHKDFVRTNNYFKNLEFLSQSGNVQHSYDGGLRKQHGLTQPVIVGDESYPSMLSAAQAIGRCVGSVASAISKGHKVAGMVAKNG